MRENWAAVAREVNSRAVALGLSQKELAQRSGVSPAILREIQHNNTQRDRSPRTLEAISVALHCHPLHLSAIRNGQPPPNLTADLPQPSDPILAALQLLTREVRGLRTEVRTLTNRLESARATSQPTAE